jgi:3-phytase
MTGRRAALVGTASVAGMITVFAVGCGGASENAQTPEQEPVIVSAEKTPPETTIDSGPTGTVNSGLISATVETDPASHAGDATDDGAIWRDDGDPSRSTLIGTDKQGAMEVYALDGSRIQSTATTGRWNNVDIRDGFPLGGHDVSLVVASKQDGLDLGVWRVDPATRNLVDVSAGVSSALDNNYGLCMYQGGGKTYVFVNSEEAGGSGQNAGEVEQIELFDDGSGKVAGRTVRTFDVGSQTEGCVADDELGHLYIGEEDVGIWKYGAEPDSGATRTLVDSTGPDGRLAADVEGLTMAYGANGTGYLIASSQGNNSFVVYKREGNNDHVKTFKVSPGDGIDGVGETDGIDVTTMDLGPDFPSGVFIAQDGTNDSGNQNFKLVPYQRIFP